MPNPLPARTGHARPRTAAAALAAVVVILPLLVGPPAAASFTALTAVADAQAVSSATLTPVTGAAGIRNADGGAEVTWDEPALRPGVSPAYEITRTVAGKTVPVAVTPTAAAGTARFTDDLTVEAGFDGVPASSIGSGTLYSCAIAEGVPYCWGRGTSGQLGDDSWGVETELPVAVVTSGALNNRPVTALSAGHTHVCAIAGGAAYCWGNGGFGKLGNASILTRTAPAAVARQAGALLGRTVTAIAAGENHSCAIADGDAYCWGAGGSGQMGNGSTASTNSAPIAVDTSGALDGKTVTAIALGANHSCAIADGDVYCWGAGASGQLGNGLNANSPVPVLVDGSAWGFAPVVALGAGVGHTCAIAAGTAYCWGAGDRGQLGNGGYANRPIPVAVSTAGLPADATFTALTGGASSTCAIASERAYCWGLNISYGQLGWLGGSTSSVPVPVDASTLAGKTVSAIDSGFTHTCVVADETPFCWGQSLGDGGATSGPQARVVAGVFAVFACEAGWLLAGVDRCAPGPDVSVRYEIGYTKAGWSPAAPSVVQATWEAP